MLITHDVLLSLKTREFNPAIEVSYSEKHHAYEASLKDFPDVSIISYSEKTAIDELITRLREIAEYIDLDPYNPNASVEVAPFDIEDDDVVLEVCTIAHNLYVDKSLISEIRRHIVYTDSASEKLNSNLEALIHYIDEYEFDNYEFIEEALEDQEIDEKLKIVADFIYSDPHFKLMPPNLKRIVNDWRREIPNN